MSIELIRIFDENHNEIGIDSRSNAHEKGLWHETFHCWIYNRTKKTIIIQLRSKMKKDYAYLFDITAAGHLLHTETALDGIREVKEELGIEIEEGRLNKIGILIYPIVRTQIKDNEFAHVFAYECDTDLKNYLVQRDEVAGVFECPLYDFLQLWLENQDELVVDGYELIDGIKEKKNYTIKRGQFVARSIRYYRTIAEEIYNLM